jgi:hypothetical protein
MLTSTTSRPRHWFNVLCAILGLLLFAAPVTAGGTKVLPSTARPKGYSLAEAAAATAYFNTGAPHTEADLPADFPF